jgi:hypothetical protein
VPDLTIEQVLAERTPAGVAVVARSPGVAEEWQPDFRRLCEAFGEPPPNTYLPPCVFAQPLTRDRVVVVQVTAEASPPVVRFHGVILAHKLYETIGDPFAVAEQFPSPWGERVALPTLAWFDGPLPARTVAQVQRVLQEDDSATLLGAAQALVDGGRVVFERPFPAPDLLRRLWLLLPESTRAELWPASYAFGNALGFHALVVPRADPAAYAGYLTESQAGDYPEGRYELNVQIAVESEDQSALDRLFARRSSRQTLRLAIVLIFVAMGLAVAVRLLG